MSFSQTPWKPQFQEEWQSYAIVTDDENEDEVASFLTERDAAYIVWLHNRHVKWLKGPSEVEWEAYARETAKSLGMGKDGPSDLSEREGFK